MSIHSAERWLGFLGCLLCAYGYVLLSSVDTNQNQCPCVLRPGTNHCLKYDSQYQASNIEEAIIFFDDMSLQSALRPPEWPDSHLDYHCKTAQCKACRKVLRQRLQTVGLFEDIFSDNGINAFLDPESDTDNSTALAESCEKYRFARNDPDAMEYHRVPHHHPTKKHKRDRRDSVSVDVVGTRYNLSCTPKGAPIDTGSSLLSLCSKCWAWRQLPANYFPQFINELTCHHGDSDCLSGFAVCGAGTHTVEVIRNDTTGPVVVTITAGSYCECQVPEGSILENLVVGEGNSSAQDPILPLDADTNSR